MVFGTIVKSGKPNGLVRKTRHHVCNLKQHSTLASTCSNSIWTLATGLIFAAQKTARDPSGGKHKSPNHKIELDTGVIKQIILWSKRADTRKTDRQTETERQRHRERQREGGVGGGGRESSWLNREGRIFGSRWSKRSDSLTYSRLNRVS